MTELLAQGPLPTRARFSLSRHPGWLCGLLLLLCLRPGAERSRPTPAPW